MLEDFGNRSKQAASQGLKSNYLDKDWKEVFAKFLPTEKKKFISLMSLFYKSDETDRNCSIIMTDYT